MGSESFFLLAHEPPVCLPYSFWLFLGEELLCSNRKLSGQSGIVLDDNLDLLDLVYLAVIEVQLLKVRVDSLLLFVVVACFGGFEGHHGIFYTVLIVLYLLPYLPGLGLVFEVILDLDSLDLGLQGQGLVLDKAGILVLVEGEILRQFWIVLGVHLEIVVIGPLKLLSPIPSPDRLDKQVYSLFGLGWQLEDEGVYFDKTSILGRHFEAESGGDGGIVLDGKLPVEELVRIV